MYYGKQLYSDGQISYISSSAPLPYSDNLIQLSEAEFNTIWETEIKPKKIAKSKNASSRRRREQLEDLYQEEITEPNQVIMIKEKDLDDNKDEEEER